MGGGYLGGCGGVAHVAGHDHQAPPRAVVLGQPVLVAARDDRLGRLPCSTTLGGGAAASSPPGPLRL